MRNDQVVCIFTEPMVRSIMRDQLLEAWPGTLTLMILQAIALFL